MLVAQREFRRSRAARQLMGMPTTKTESPNVKQ
eukprot:SAG31_NODE_70_length_28117_cov_100.521843_27_plen_33_part_00